MRMFLRKAAVERDPLPVTMSGVRMGELVLQIGINDPRIAGAIAVKAGLSGHAAVAVRDAEAAERARRGAVAAGALIDVQATAERGSFPLERLVELVALAEGGIEEIRAAQRTALA